MSWKKVQLKDIGEIVTGSTPSKSNTEYYGSEIPFISPTELGKKIYVDRSKQYLSLSGAEVARILPANSVMVCCIGSLGKTAIAATPLATNQQINSIVVNESVADPLYVYFYCSTLKNTLEAIAPATTVAIVNKSRFSELEIPLPPLAIQKQIAAVLEKADTLRSQCQQMEQELNALAQSVFLDMFGDPVANPKGWMRTSLTEHGDFKNGLNFAKSETGVNVKYLGIGDFKSLDQIKDVSSLGTVELNELPQNDYLLDDGDIVFVRSNGNKALVGRCLTIYTEDKVTFSGFCIRYRVNDHKLAPEFLNYLFRTPSIKQALLQGGQGANIQNINQKILSSIPIIFPPTEAQESFVEFLEALRAQRVLAKEKLEKQKSMFNSLMQRAFKGELKLKGVA